LSHHAQTIFAVDCVRTADTKNLSLVSIDISRYKNSHFYITQRVSDPMVGTKDRLLADSAGVPFDVIIVARKGNHRNTYMYFQVPFFLVDSVLHACVIWKHEDGEIDNIWKTVR
jgi:hypothetical protein